MPQLLEMSVRFFTPLFGSAAIRFSGFPHRPNPPDIIVAPSGMSATASSALATTLFMSPPGSALDHQGDAFAAADAERGHAALLAQVLHRLEQRHQDPRARGADRVAERRPRRRGRSPCDGSSLRSWLLAMATTAKASLISQRSTSLGGGASSARAACLIASAGAMVNSTGLRAALA